MLPGRTPTVNEQRWMNLLVEQVGCIVCRRFHGVITPPEIHHLDGKTKPEAHFRTIPLCYRHHRSGEVTHHYVSYHPHSRQFENRYGTVEELWRHAVDLVGLNPLTGEAPVVQGGMFAKRAALLCQDPQFHLFLDRYRSYIREIEIPDGTHNADDAREAILTACRIRSRKLLDHDLMAQGMFMKIVAKFNEWKVDGRLVAARPHLDSIRQQRGK